MNIYLSSGYLDMDSLINLGYPFLFIVGGRSTGKTYGTLKHMVVNKKKIMFMRRSLTQVEIINQPAFCPLKPVCRDLGFEYESEPIIKSIYGWSVSNSETGDEFELGATCSLSTTANLRGFDASETQYLIFDEFVPEPTERVLKHEGKALLNVYETLSRNRELDGRPPLGLIGLANSNNLANPLFIEFDLIGTAERMIKKGINVSINQERGIVLVILGDDSPISQQKATGALYNALEESEFTKMSLANKFTAEKEFVDIKSVKLVEYKPIANIGRVTIYAHKHTNKIFISSHKNGSCVTYTDTDIDKTRFLRDFGWIWLEYVHKNLWFESYAVKAYLTTYMK